MTGIRKSVYFSESKDGDILAYIKPLLETLDFSSIIRDLVRDGIRFRHNPVNSNVTQSMTPTETKPIEHVELKAKDVSNIDLEDRLDSF